MQKWPRDVDIRRGLLSGLWTDLSSLVAARDVHILDARGAGVPLEDFLKKLTEFEDGPVEAAVRWAIVLGDNARLRIQLQGLPGSAASLEGKPSLKG
jgi:hypothetical protein